MPRITRWARQREDRSAERPARRRKSIHWGIAITLDSLRIRLLASEPTAARARTTAGQTPAMAATTILRRFPIRTYLESSLLS